MIYSANIYYDDFNQICPSYFEELELFWFSFFGEARARALLFCLFWGTGARAGKARQARLELEPSFSFFHFVFWGEPEPEIAKIDRPGSSWSRVLVFICFDLVVSSSYGCGLTLRIYSYS